MTRTRIILAVVGIMLALFGVFRLVTEVPILDLVGLAIWLIAAIVIHDGVLSPLILAVGRLIGRIPSRPRGYLQTALVVAVPVVVIALPMIARQHGQPRAKALLDQDFAANLGIVIVIIAVATLVIYAVNTARRHAADETTPRPKVDHT